MKKGFFIVITLLVVTMTTWTTGCTEKRTDSSDSIVDSTLVDSVEEDTIDQMLGDIPMPKAADELFDDFIFNFAANRKLQLERISFPLTVDNYGKQTTMEKRQWRNDHFFLSQGFYTMVVGDMREMEGAKSTKIDHVTIEKVFLHENYVKQYIFNRVDGLWMLQTLRSEAMSKNANGDFYSFYDRFVNDSTFQQQSLAESVEFSGPDPDDDFSRMEGTIMPEQWSMFAPELPKGMIYNIIYGDAKPKGKKRILVVRGIANGLETELTFNRSKDGWMLTQLNI